MSQFAQSTSAMDSAIGEDADRGFERVNQRLQLNQLQAGEVRESLNGRMEGYWKPRKNVVSKTGALTTSSNPLFLPFLLVGIADGDLNFVLENGSTLVTEGGVTIAAEENIVTTTSKPITAATYLNDVVTITIDNHGVPVGSIGLGTISGLVATSGVVDGNRIITYVSANQLSFPVTDVTGPITDGVGLLEQTPINDFAAGSVRSSCLFSDPNDSNKEYVIIAMDTKAKKIDLNGYGITDLAYPQGATVGKDTDMIQVFDKIMLFRDGQQALEWYPHGRPIVSASQAGTTVVTMNVKNHGLTVNAPIVITGLTGGTPPNGSFIVATVISADQFTYIGPTSQTQVFGVSLGNMSDGFTFSPGGIYTQPQVFISEKLQVNCTNGLVSLAVSGNVTIQSGDIITIYETEIPEFSAIVGKEYQVANATTTLVQFYAPIANFAGIGSTLQIQFGGRFSIGGGFMHQPGAPWGIHFQRRLWVPFYYNQSGSYNAPNYVNRKITDEISVSDILDTTTFDQIANQFRVSGGTSDFVVAMHGFYEDKLVVLNRNSLHLISGTLGSLLDTKVTELTAEVGCLARKSVVMRGNAMLFLSDDGVYGVEFLNDYNLRGTDEPLSKNIQPYIDRINKNFSSKSVGILFENRYYLAVPLDSKPGANDSYGNNSILVFNFLNKGWESLDTFGDSRFLIESFVIGSANERNNLYVVNSNGGLHQIETDESSNDILNIDNSSSIVSPIINSSLTTRGYDLGTMERKRFTDAQVNIQSLPGQNAEYNIAFAAEDPDDAQDIGTTTELLGGLLIPSTATEAETASVRCRLGGIRGFTGTMILTRNVGSPKINSIKVAGSVTNRQILSQK